MAGETRTSSYPVDQPDQPDDAGGFAAPPDAELPVRTVQGAPLAPERAAAMQVLVDLLARAPEQFDFFQVMRRLEHLYCDSPDRPRFGAALRPVDEPIRLGQDPSLAFASRTLNGVQPSRTGAPPRLTQNFFGLMGPNGPLPMHLTEYARDRLRNTPSDPTMTHFLDIFHHRLLMFFYRAWASTEPTASHDRPETDRFL